MFSFPFIYYVISFKDDIHTIFIRRVAYMKFYPFRKIINRILLIFLITFIFMGPSSRGISFYLFDSKMFLVIVISVVIALVNYCISVDDSGIKLMGIRGTKYFQTGTIKSIRMVTSGYGKSKRTYLYIKAIDGEVKYATSHFNNKILKECFESYCRSYGVEFDDSQLRFIYGELI